jgi:hypothetical protein
MNFRTRSVLVFALVATVAGGLAAQQAVKLPRASQHAVLTQTIGLTDMTIVYSRPGAKSRKVFGELVPFGQVWRTGANEATTINFSEPVTINGQKLAAGSYSLHTIPGADSWTLIFNSVDKQWGSFTYDQTKDALRVQAKPTTAPFTEWFTVEVPSLSTDQATVALRWETTQVAFVIGTDTTNSVLANLRAAIATAKPDDWRTTMRAAQFAFENKVAGDSAAGWLEQSIKTNENINNLYLKARMTAAAGHRDEAIRIAQQAIGKATDKDKDEVAEIQKNIDRWKAGKQ